MERFPEYVWALSAIGVVISPITTYFRVCDGVRVRFADNQEDSDPPLPQRAADPSCQNDAREGAPGRLARIVSAIG